MSKKSEYHLTDERRFLDERGSTAPLAPNGLNPATIMEKAVRERIVESYFWKEQCFGVNEADIVDRVVEHVSYVGGVTGAAVPKPTPFLCLAFKLLQLAPTDAVLEEYLRHGGEKFKYLRALAAFYIRLTRPDRDVYTLLEPFLADSRKLRRRGRDKGMTLTYMDVFVDDLLTKSRVLATSLPKMRSRDLLEDLDLLEPRVSPLGNIEDLLEEEEEDIKQEREQQQQQQQQQQQENGYDSDVSVKRESESPPPAAEIDDSSDRKKGDDDSMDVDQDG